MSEVKLYVYDLSNGMARQLSQQLTGRQIDGIWHTSVVVFGKEIFYGQGINTTAPGRSHHGAPMQIIDMGETALDEETFDEYLQEMKQHYTADKYHLLEFNCNSFTDDCVGFLTGGNIPSFIKDLPTDFLSTPFGAALRPTIDAMYRRPVPGPVAPPAPSTTAATDPQLAASILQAVASQAQAGGYGQGAAPPSQATNSLVAPVHIITNPASFKSFLRSHKAAVAFFTSETCGPCKMIEPIFERLAEEKGSHEGRNGASFAKIDIDVGQGQTLASEWGVRATPTFMFFLAGEKLDELKGADKGELRTQVDLLLFQAYPPHPHTSIPMPAVQALSLNPIIFSQVPPIDTVLSKLTSFIDTQPWPSTAAQSQAQAKSTLSNTVGPYLKSRFATTPPPTVLPSATPAILTAWTHTSSILASVLPVDSLFPLVDMWRLAFLDPAVGKWAAGASPDPVSTFLPNALDSSSAAPSKGARNYLLTALRMLCNAFSAPALAQRILGTARMRTEVTRVLVPSLLHADATVRTAGASLAFDIAAVVQKRRVEAVRTGRGIREEDEAEEDRDEWDVEMISALLEAVDRERENEEVVHRLVAALAFFLRLAPQYDAQIAPLLEVLQSREILRRKLSTGDGWTAAGGIGKKEVRRLVGEVAEKLCK
ncbi:PPPDE putative peptidase domain-containing protein [Pholiota molesta]|nr:PPPDE putative peptidase domain-containing protein [Pholiota molesta]